MTQDAKTEVNTRLLLQAANSFTFPGQGCQLRVSCDTDESAEGDWVIHRFYEEPWYRIGGREVTSYFPPAILAQVNAGPDTQFYWAPWHPEKDLNPVDFWYTEKNEDLNEAVALALRIAAGDLEVVEASECPGLGANA